jgi:DNA end-binding protein Ku
VRPYWKGYLKLALVSCPIALHAACSTAERIAFRQVNKVTGNRLRQRLVDEGTLEPVAPEHKARGYEIAKGQYLLVEDAELETIEIASTHTIEIDSFVPRAQIDQRFLDRPYYITPSEPVEQEAFAVIREATLGKGMVALGRLVLSKRERVIALAYDKGLLGTTLRYPYEVRKAEVYFCDLPDLTIAPDLLAYCRQQDHRFRPIYLPRSLRGGAARAPEGQTVRRRARAQADGCSAAVRDQSHGGAGLQRRGGQKSRLAQGSAPTGKRA